MTGLAVATFPFAAEAQSTATDTPPARSISFDADAAGQFSLEYFSGSEVAAYLILRPGLYFGGHPGTDSWDIPIECATGIPLTAGLEGALGVSDGRLWRGPVPVIGLVWDIATGIRLDAVYPEPDLVVALGKRFAPP